MDNEVVTPTRWPRRTTALFVRAEHLLYLLLALLLCVTCILALASSAQMLVHGLQEWKQTNTLFEVIDRLLVVLMLVEILHTVLVSVRSGTLTCEPFLIVGLIASIRRVLVITLQSSEIMHAKDWSPEKQALFQASMIELGVLAGLIITMVFAIFLLHRARDDGRPAGDEAASSGP